MNSPATGPTARRVLDASALLAVLLLETGAEEVEAVISGTLMSAVNLAEVIAKLIDRGAAAQSILGDLADLEVEIVPFDCRQAELAGLLRATTRGAGLSLGDRACLALASQSSAIAVSADRAWKDLDVGVAIELVR